MTLSSLGVLCAEGGTTFVVYDAPPNAGVEWSVAGGGTLSPTTDRTNANGVATARFDASGVTAGTSISVTVNVYA